MPGKKNKIQGIYKVLGGTLFVLVLALIVVVVIMNSNSMPTGGDMTKLRQNAKFVEGVSVQSVPLGGMTYAEAKSKMADAESKLKDSLNIPLTLDTFGFLFKAGEDFDVTLNTETALDQAIAFGNFGGNKEKDKETAQTEGKNFDITYTIDTSKIADKVKAFAAKVNRPATDATAEPIKYPGANDTDSSAASTSAVPSFKYSEGQTGIKVDEGKLTQTLSAKLSARDFSAATIPADVVKPAVTVEQLKKITVQVSKFRTDFDNPASLYRASRVFNIAKAADMINGQVIQPGEQWSINAVLGDRSNQKNGWQEAPGYENAIVTDQLGGGVCQVSTTLYVALLKADIAKDTMERKHHTFLSHYVDAGMDATISSGSPDFKFVNSKSTPIYIFTKVDKTEKYIEIYIYGEPLPAGETINIKSVTISQSPPAQTIAYQVDPEALPGTQPKLVRAMQLKTVCKTTREYYQDGKLVNTEPLFTDTYVGLPNLYMHSADVTPPAPDDAPPASPGAN